MKFDQNKLRNFFLTYVLPFTLFLIITFVINPNIFTGFSTQIEKNDGRLLAWTVSWDIHKLLTDPLNIYNANIFYPNANTLTYSEHFIGGSILALPVWLITGGNPAASFNFLMILGYTLNAFCAYILIKYLTKSRLSGIIGGIIFGYCSYRIANFGHLQNMLVFYIPLLVYFFYKYIELRKNKFLTGAGISLLMMSLTSWYHMIFIWAMFVLFLLYFLFRKKLDKKDLIKIGILIITNLLIILPFALPYFEFNKQNQSAYSINELKTYSADIGGYLMSPPNTFFGGVVLPWLKITKERWQENINFIGYIALVLSFIAVFTIRKVKNGISVTVNKSRLIFAGIGLCFVLLSFGPFLHLSDEVTRVPLLYWLVFNVLPPIRFIRVTGRFATVVMLFVGILAGFGFTKILNKLKSRKSALILASLLGILILGEYYPYHNFFKYEDVSKTPEIYNQIKSDDSIKALVELPINVGPFETTKYVYYAGVHFKPIVNGYSGYEPKDYNFNKHLFENSLNDFGIVKLIEMGVTHVLINPGYEKDVTSTNLTLVSEIDGYRLYKIQDNPEELVGYYTDFSENKVVLNTKEPIINFTNSQINKPTSGTPIHNISPSETDILAEIEVNSETEFEKLFLNFRAYSEDDRVEIDCVTQGENNVEFSYSNVEYLKKPLEVECDSTELKVYLYSTEIKDRSMITSIGFAN